MHASSRELVQDVPLSVFTELKHGDVLFVDSSHVAAFGSDAGSLD
jgi:hypothetical protein